MKSDNPQSPFTYIIYDDRAADGNTDRACVLGIEYGRKVALRYARQNAGVVFRYRASGENNDLLVDETRITE